MSKKQTPEEKVRRLAVERLMLLEQFKRKSDEVNRLLQDFDLHGVDSDIERQEFWERYTVEGAELISLFGQISKMQGGGGRERILEFLQRHVGEVVEGITLYAVSGVSENRRRTRELREQGWRISSHEQDPLLKPGQYRLESLERDPEKARAYAEKQKRIKRGNKPQDPELRLI